jgi:serine/threonine-protein kinase
MKVATRAIAGRAKVVVDDGAASPSLAAGAIVAGRFRLERLLGEGGMGAVWAARHVVTKRAVAIKFLKEPKSRDFVERFVREAQAANAVRHPNVVQVHDLFTLDTGEPAMVMDLFEGETLAARLERKGVLGLDEVARVMQHLVSALAAIHAAGIVHRDLKPENIFIARLPAGAEQPMLLDFGVCKLDSLGSSLNEDASTTVGRVIGSPCYMAPEQARGAADLDAGADVWSLGTILYECITGVRPFDGDSLAQVVARVTTGNITRVEQLLPEVPAELARLIHRMLERQRSERLSDLGEVLAVMEQLAPSTAPRDVVPAPGAVATTARRAVPSRDAETLVRAKLSTLGGSSLSASVPEPAPTSRPSAATRLARLAAGAFAVGLLAALLASISERGSSAASTQQSSVASASAIAMIEAAPSPAADVDAPAAVAASAQPSRQAPATSPAERPATHRNYVRPIPNFGGRR